MKPPLRNWLVYGGLVLACLGTVAVGLLMPSAEPVPVDARLTGWEASVEAGHHAGFVREVRARMGDPWSFIHLETTYRYERGDTVYLMMAYRAKNRFGGWERMEAQARICADSGRLLKVWCAP